MRTALQAGALGGGALLASLKAAQEEEDIGSSLLGAVGGGAAGLGGLYGARYLAGKFAPQLAAGINRLGVDKSYRYLTGAEGNMPKGYKVTTGFDRVSTVTPDGKVNVTGRAAGPVKAGGPFEKVAPKSRRKIAKEIIGQYNPNLEMRPEVARYLGGATALATVPTAAYAGGFGGVVTGGALGAVGMPGFVDPEAYGSSNSPGARYKQSTVNYM